LPIGGEDIDRRFQKALEEKRPQTFERQYRRKDGSIIDVWGSAHFIPYGGRDVMCTLVRDLTERKKTEQELLKASKLKSVGTLAGGIAHDFNNILTSILSNISLAKSQISPQDKIFKRLSEAERASLRAKGLTQQLLTFSKGGDPVRETTSLPHLLKESAHFALSGSKVECEFSQPEDLWSADIDEEQISQAIQNLILNADQAMPQGGRIGVTAENAQLTDWDQSIVPLSEGRYVKVSVRDQGIGIPREHLSKVFDPFFTTKQRRSGLGLSTAYSIIKNHGGYLSVESDLGKGTTFTFYLPASSQEAPVENTKEEIPITGKGRVLIMDDEEGIRLSAADVLAYLGYEAALAKDGSEAIQLYQEAKESGHPFAAVIMDLTIPGGVGGQEAIQRLLELDPGVKAIVSSGYSQNPILSNFRKYGFSGVLTKPYKIQEMGQILQEVLGKEGEIGH
jgi:signal transduction histidine kinase/CheY-like chemotaxis protein